MRNHRKLGSTGLLLALGLMVAVITGCRGTPGTDPPPVAAPETTGVPLTTLPPETTTTTMAIPDTTGTDLVKVVQNLDLLQNLASERVDLSLLDLIYTPDAEERVVFEKQLRNLRENGLHYDDSARSTVSDVKVQTPLEGVAIVDFTSEQGPQVLKNASGQVVETGEGWTPRRQRYGLFRGDDGRWRIRDASVLGPA